MPELAQGNVVSSDLRDNVIVFLRHVSVLCYWNLEMSVHVRPCRCILLIPPTRNVPTQLTRSLWEVAVISSPAVEATVVHIQKTLRAPETRDGTHYTGVKCVHIASAVIVWRVVDITVTNGD